MSTRLTVPEVADELRCSARFVRDEIARGNLPASKVGRQLLIEAHDVQAYVAARTTTPTGARRARRPRARGAA